jgi:choline dehydrogenase-like flavoprotein
MPPMPIKSSGVLMEKAAAELGWHAQPEPHAILSKPHNGRGACVSCGYCMWYGCEAGAKSSTLAAMIPLAEASGNCEIRPESVVIRIDTNEQGRANQVIYLDKDGVEHAQKAKAVVLSANGAESSRLLLMSASSQHPDGLANSSGFVGRNLMYNQHSLAIGVYEHPLNDYKGVQVSFFMHLSVPTRMFRVGARSSRIRWRTTSHAHCVLSLAVRRWPWTATTSRSTRRARTPGDAPPSA